MGGTLRHYMFSYTFWTSWTPNTHFYTFFLGNSGRHSPALYVFLYFLDLLNAKYIFFLGNCEGDSPGLYVFPYLLDLLNAKYTFLAAKRFRYFPPALKYNHSSFFHRQDPLVQAWFGEYLCICIRKACGVVLRSSILHFEFVCCSTFAHHFAMPAIASMHTRIHNLPRAQSRVLAVCVSKWRRK